MNEGHASSHLEGLKDSQEKATSEGILTRLRKEWKFLFTVALLTVIPTGVVLQNECRDRRTEMDKLDDKLLVYRQRLLKLLEAEYVSVIAERYPADQFPRVHTDEFRDYVVRRMHKVWYFTYLNAELGSPVEQIHMNSMNAVELAKNPRKTFKDEQASWKNMRTIRSLIRGDLVDEIEYGLLRLQETGSLPAVLSRGNEDAPYDPLRANWKTSK